MFLSEKNCSSKMEVGGVGGCKCLIGIWVQKMDVGKKNCSRKTEVKNGKFGK